MLAAGRNCVFAIGAAFLLAGCATPPAPPPSVPLTELHAWAIQLSGIERPGAVDRLSRARADLVVIDRLSTLSEHANYPIRAVVDQIRATPGPRVSRKLCLGYLNVGEAESYRTYWGESWRKPEAGSPAEPAFLLGDDPDGWPGNHPVAYWDPEWRRVVTSEVEAAIAEGFDGLMLDWVDGFEAAIVADAADAVGVDPAVAMADLIGHVEEVARARRPGFLVLLNGGMTLLARVPDLAVRIDGVVRESVWFSGRAVDGWDDPAGADGRVERPEPALRALDGLRARGVAIFVLDYASVPANRVQAIALARKHGFVPFVSRTALDRLPDEAVER